MLFEGNVQITQEADSTSMYYIFACEKKNWTRKKQTINTRALLVISPGSLSVSSIYHSLASFSPQALCLVEPKSWLFLWWCFSPSCHKYFPWKKSFNVYHKRKTWSFLFSIILLLRPGIVWLLIGFTLKCLQQRFW